MNDINKLLQEALKRHQTGDLKVSETLYRKVIAEEPDNIDALFLLGTLRSQLKDYKEALLLLNRAIQIKPDQAEIHNNIGGVYKALGMFNDAAASYGKAMLLNPDYAEAHNNLGVVLTKQDKHDAAIASFKQAIQLRHDYADAYNNLGNVFRVKGNTNKAITCFNQAIKLKPDNADAYYNLGITFYTEGRYEEAAGSYNRAIEIDPDNAGVHNNLGVVLKSIGKTDEAIASFSKAIKLCADHVDAYYNLGNTLWDIKRHKDAIENYKTALKYDPAHTEARWNLAIALLLTGNYEQGWSEFEIRFQRKTPAPRLFKQPKWDGSFLGDKTILVYAEQGFGDTFQFARFLPMVKAKGGRVIFECQKNLSPLLKSCIGIDEIIEHTGSDELQIHFDTHIPLLSLPGLFHVNLNTLPSKVPYIFADPALTDAWRKRLNGDDTFKIGIVWAGNPRNVLYHSRTCPLTEFGVLNQIKDVTFFNLQKGHEASEIVDLPNNMKVVNHESALKSFSDTAALIANLDMVISTDNGVAHLVGALGKPMWVLTAYSPDWRWMMDREDSPWYPTARLFRQPEEGDWKTVMQRVANELKSVVNKG